MVTPKIFLLKKDTFSEDLRFLGPETSQWHIRVERFSKKFLKILSSTHTWLGVCVEQNNHIFEMKIFGTFLQKSKSFYKSIYFCKLKYSE
jgi:hypothetical protein